MPLFPHGLVFTLLTIFFLVHTYVFLKGRKVFNYIKRNHPQKWETLGKPQPYYLIPHQQWWLFLKQNKFIEFNDPQLNGLCNNQLKREKHRVIIGILLFLGIAGLALWESFI